MKFTTTILLVCALAGVALGQNPLPHTHAPSRAIHFPDVPGFQTLVCDFHMHTVLSDGSVWPDIRVEEALRDSVDVISLTEHLEYQPHSADVPHPDRNRAFELATQFALPYDRQLMVIPGAEITRKMPPGHTNAIFITDANALLIEDSLAVFQEAARQGAFTFWNHPNWIAQRRDGVARLTDFHHELIERGLLQGIEVVNDLTFSDEALQIALDYNLTIMATSDIHGLVDWQYKISEGGHRPVTLVLATERTPAAIKEALLAHRTVGWFNNLLIGREAELLPLLAASLEVTKATYLGISSVADVTIMNHSDATFILQNTSSFNLHDLADVVVLAPNSPTTFQVKTLERDQEVNLQFVVMNALTAPRQHPEITIAVGIPE
jgi:3',5'-nucleoside bisphosphate phosphatase